jgi:hypothetical protein
MKIEIKSYFSGQILFAHDCDNNTIKITVEAGVKINADLRGADLWGADLRGAVLTGAVLRGAVLTGAVLRDKENPISKIKQFGFFGSRDGFTIAFRCKKTIEINCGCFWGNLAKFETRVMDKPEGDIHRFEYLALIDFIKKIWEVK